MSNFAAKLTSRRGLLALAAITVGFFVAAAILGNGHHGLRGTIANIAWFGFLLSALTLIATSVATLARSRRGGGAMLSVLVIGVVIAGVAITHAAAGRSSSRASGPGQVRLIVPLAQQRTHVSDVAPSGPSAGDELQGSGPLTTPAGRPAGKVDLVATNVDRRIAVLQGTLRLAHGQIAIQGSTSDLDNTKIAVVGGTRRYRHATGTVTVRTRHGSHRARVAVRLG